MVAEVYRIISLSLGAGHLSSAKIGFYAERVIPDDTWHETKDFVLRLVSQDRLQDGNLGGFNQSSDPAQRDPMECLAAELFRYGDINGHVSTGHGKISQ